MDATSLHADSGLNAFDAYAAPIPLGGWRVDRGIPYAASIAIGLMDVIANAVCVVGIRAHGQWHASLEKAIQQGLLRIKIGKVLGQACRVDLNVDFALAGCLRHGIK